jgi:hypothetical protein
VSEAWCLRKSISGGLFTEAAAVDELQETIDTNDHFAEHRLFVVEVHTLEYRVHDDALQFQPAEEVA